MRYLKLFEEFESSLLKAADELRTGSKEILSAAEKWRDRKLGRKSSHIDFQSPGIETTPYVEADPEDLNIPRMEKRTIIDAIIKNYTKSYNEIAKILGVDPRTLHRKLAEYDLRDLKRQIKMRKGKPWDHPYNEIVPKTSPTFK